MSSLLFPVSQGCMIKMENFQKLLELKKDLIGIDNLVIPGRSTRRISLKSNAIVIEEDGYYYVYSQATFLVKKKDVQLGMTLFKNSPSYQKNRTVCETMDSPHWKERTVPRTLSQGTVVKLEEDDELQIAVQPEEILDLDSMFFGAFKISE
ncbi:UNVERIFIED_CONTAM: hypothetical protein FKN15_036106 [Acipenser sinensis]